MNPMILLLLVLWGKTILSHDHLGREKRCIDMIEDCKYSCYSPVSLSSLEDPAVMNMLRRNCVMTVTGCLDDLTYP